MLDRGIVKYTKNVNVSCLWHSYIFMCMPNWYICVYITYACILLTFNNITNNKHYNIIHYYACANWQWKCVYLTHSSLCSANMWLCSLQMSNWNHALYTENWSTWGFSYYSFMKSSWHKRRYAAHQIYNIILKNISIRCTNNDIKFN